MGSVSLLDAVQAVVQTIPAGDVRTYGEIAAALGFRAARHTKEVKAAMARLVTDQQRPAPWWRVVGNDGRLIPSAAPVQQAMLQGEGVACNAEGKVKLRNLGAG